MQPASWQVTLYTTSETIVIRELLISKLGFFFFVRIYSYVLQDPLEKQRSWSKTHSEARRLVAWAYHRSKVQYPLPVTRYQQPNDLYPSPSPLGSNIYQELGPSLKQDITPGF